MLVDVHGDSEGKDMIINVFLWVFMTVRREQFICIGGQYRYTHEHTHYIYRIYMYNYMLSLAITE